MGSLNVNMGLVVLLRLASCRMPVLLAGTEILSSREAMQSGDQGVGCGQGGGCVGPAVGLLAAWARAPRGGVIAE